MICGTELAYLKDGKLYSNDAKTHVLFSKTHKGIYVVNMCKNCAKTLDFTSQATLDEIHETVVRSKELELIAQGLPSEDIATQVAKWNSDRPQVGWYKIEHKTKDRSKNIKSYLEYYEAQHAS